VNREKVKNKKCREALLRRTEALIAVIAMTLGVLPAQATGANSMLIDRAGATMMSYRALIEARAKFDRKLVWVIGGLKFSNGTAYLGETATSNKMSQKSVCIAPLESFTGSAVDPGGSEREAILRRFDGLGVSVHGRYESAATSRCPNGTLFAALLEVSLE